MKIYRVTDRHIDIEEVAPIRSTRDEGAIVAAAAAAKDHLQSLGIMYIDWKPDNLGKGTDGRYKLFDFDASGIISADNKWVIKPNPWWSYGQALASGLKDPREIDNFAFDIGFIRENYIPVNSSAFL